MDVGEYYFEGNVVIGVGLWVEEWFDVDDVLCFVFL